MADLASLSEHARGLHGVPAQCVPRRPGLEHSASGDTQDTVPELARFPFLAGALSQQQHTQPRHTSDTPLRACRSFPHPHSYILCLHGVLISWALIASTLGPSWYAHTKSPTANDCGYRGGRLPAPLAGWSGRWGAQARWVGLDAPPAFLVSFAVHPRHAPCCLYSSRANVSFSRLSVFSSFFRFCCPGCGRTCSSSCCWSSACLRTGRCRRCARCWPG